MLGRPAYRRSFRKVKGLEFYSAAAQIIPLLLILLAFQARSFASGRLSKWAYWIVVFAFMGETCALTALYFEEAPLLFPLMVSAVLAMLGLLFFLAIVLAPPGGLLSIRPSARKDEDA